MEESLEEWLSVSDKKSAIRIPGGKDKNKTLFNIGIWNVQNMSEAGKPANVIQEINRLNINILEISATWWPGSEECNTEFKRVYFTGNNDRKYIQDIGITVTKDIAKIVN